MSTHVGQRAVVLGGSMAGLCAARALSEAYREVVVVDRDDLAGAGDGARRGVPQGRHAHGFLAAGQLALEELFPGFTAELTSAGVPIGDIGGQMRWYFNGRQLKQVRTGLYIVGTARPILEAHVRRRVAALPGVTFLGSTDVVGPVTTPDGSRVTGVRVHELGAPDGRVLTADLVVDATGRASRTATWLRDAGYPEVREDRIGIGLAYTSRQLRLRRDPFGTDVSINPVATPANPRGAFLHTLGGDRALLSLTGVLGDHPPTDPEGFLAYAKSLVVPDVYAAVHDAEPLTEPVTFRFPASRRLRYEKLGRFPDGLLVVGDAVCSFNPVYGQGMTVAALEALALRRQLAGGEPSPRAFLAEIARIVDAPWEIAAGGDLAYPEVEGRRSLQVRIGNAYMARLHRAATVDGDVVEAFMRVAGLVDPPQSVMRPSIALKVLRGSRAAGRTGGVAGRDGGDAEQLRDAA